MVCFIVCILCIAISINRYQYARSFLNNITLVSLDDAFDHDTLMQIVQPDKFNEETYTAAAWSERKNQTVVADENQRSCQTDVIAVYGSSRCILPYGKNLQTEQKDGCIISEQLAEELFASHQVEGQKISYAGRIWRICGVIRQPKRLVLLEGTELLDEIPFDHISITATDHVQRRLVAERFINRYGISAQMLRLDFYGSAAWLAEMIPTKWSDFEGWEQNWKDKKQDMQFMAGTEKSAIELLYLQYVKSSYRFFGMAMTLLAIEVVLLKFPNKKVAVSME